MKNRRICTEVISKMINVLPKDQDDFREALNWNLNDASYKAPEETLQWERTQSTLEKFIPKPSEDWHFEILSIFTTRSIDELKELIKNE